MSEVEKDQMKGFVLGAGRLRPDLFVSDREKGTGDSEKANNGSASALHLRFSSS